VFDHSEQPVRLPVSISRRPEKDLLLDIEPHEFSRAPATSLVTTW
jgi:hypothetical protein